MSSDANMNEMVREFLLESFEEIAHITDGLTKLEQDPQSTEIMNSIYRSMHTIKGATAFLQFSQVESFAHFIENLLDEMRNGSLQVNSELIDILLKATDHITASLNQIELTGNDEGCGNEDFIASVKLALPSGPKDSPIEDVDAMSEASHSEEQAPTEASPVVQVENDIVALKAELEKVDIANKDESQSLPSEKVIKNAFSPSVAPVVANKKNDVEDAMSKHNELAISDTVIKVHVNLLDKMMNVVGELVLNRNQILQYSSMSESPELVKLANELNNITSELQSDIMATRMQPIGSVLGKFERLVRDLSRATGKKVNLKLEGQDTELDRTIIEAIKDPLTHLVRNSIDHGLELPDARVAKGKEAQGTLLLKAYHEGGQVTIEIRDDGNGLNSEKILAKALEKNLVSEDKARELSENQIHHLIFTPGFSTADQVTNLSGRGVGMDVVKTNIEKIGGQVDVSSKKDEGTIFKLKIPLTLAIIPALVVRANDEPFAIPQINLVELVRLDASTSNTIENIGSSEFLRLRGKLLPVLRLNQILGYVDAANQQSDENLSKELNVVILNAEGLVYGLVVDGIQDTQEIVVKPLGQHLKDLSVYAGATIMGDGDVALILDAMGLVQGHQKNVEVEKAMQDSESYLESSMGFRDGQEMILFSLSSNATFGVPLALVNRLEEFKRSQIEQVGKIPVIRYRNTVMPIINLNKYLSLGEDQDFQESFSVLVVKNKSKYFGLMVNSVLDIQMSKSAELDANHGKQKGILGSAFVGEQTVSVVDIFEIIEAYGGQVEKYANTRCGVGKTALVVDDSPFFRKIEIDAMKDQGFRVIEASNGAEALEKLEANVVDIVISDIEMPVMNGLELAKKVRSNESFKNLPLVAVTTKFDEQARENGIASGFSSYLEKFNKEEVLEVVSQYMGRVS